MAWWPGQLLFRRDSTIDLTLHISQKILIFSRPAATWLSAWILTAASVSRSGVSAPSTPGITPSSFHRQVNKALLLILFFAIQCVFILISPSEVEANPALWLTAVSQYKVSLIPTILHRCIMKIKRCELRPSLYLKVRDTFCSYGVMELCTRGLVSFLLTVLTKMLLLNSYH